MFSQHQYKNILCIRADNMGDLLMSSPAIRSLKETFGAKITLLTSTTAAGIVKQIPEIDDVIIADLLWVKTAAAASAVGFLNLIEQLKERDFDLAIILSVYSQNPLPAAMLAWLANIPARLSYCRENPYELLTNWVPDEEPYSKIKHQVRRDLDLVATIGAFTSYENISIINKPEVWEPVEQKLKAKGVDLGQPWLMMHAGVSEKKREYPAGLWVETARKIIKDLGYQILFTGSEAEKPLTDSLQQEAGIKTFSLGGVFSLEEFTSLIGKSPVIISVNTASVHLAAATGTPVIVLYALTNPQHSPWKVTGKVLPFDVPEAAQSKNEVIRHASKKYLNIPASMVTPDEIFEAAAVILNGGGEMIPELIGRHHLAVQ